MIGRYPDDIVQVVCGFMVPGIMLYGLYVIAHGHYGPGGGFQGGVILAVGVILLRLFAGEEVAFRRFPPYFGLAAGASGMLLFVAVGLVPLAFSGGFLDYAALPLSWLPPDARRYWGILFVEVAIAFTVMGTLVLIFDRLVGRKP